MKQKIIQRLREIEAAHHVKVLYACEAGSRAWGFPSQDSDYDVRFLYLHPPEWYLSIQKKRDVIECPLSERLDISGWDLQKALWLFYKSNPPLMEWLGSPMVYLEEYTVTQRMRALLGEYYSPMASSYHYLHMARNNYREYLRGDTVWRKKYLYVLRPLLAVQWIEKGYGVVPTEFETLLEKLITDPTLKGVIETLVRAKRAGKELDRGPRIDVLNQFIEQQLARLQTYEIKHQKQAAPIEKLDELFIDALAEVWGLARTTMARQRATLR